MVFTISRIACWVLCHSHGTDVIHTHFDNSRDYVQEGTLKTYSLVFENLSQNFPIPFRFGLEILKILVEWKAPQDWCDLVSLDCSPFVIP